VRYWKSQVSKRLGPAAGKWQAGCWDTWLRRTGSYDEKWEYVRANPVRKGLVSRPEDWPYQGEIQTLPW
jgi:putative transposase